MLWCECVHRDARTVTANVSSLTAYHACEYTHTHISAVSHTFEFHCVIRDTYNAGSSSVGPPRNRDTLIVVVSGI